MDINQESLGPGITLVELDGRLDARTTPHVRTALQKLLAKDNLKLVINLTKVSFIDSSGLAALVSGLRIAREKKGGDIVLCGAQSQAQIVFRLTMLDRVFIIHPTLEDAKQNLL